MALRMCVVTIIALLLLLDFLIYYIIFGKHGVSVFFSSFFDFHTWGSFTILEFSITERMMMRHGKIRENFDLRLNRTHLLYLLVLKSLSEKTKYKTPLRKSNFWASARTPSVSATPPPY
ncbi:hypothetical protein RDI58_004100 [Solanum bulbocastanum]|uniref:Uncharacterized protein n=1 Tax=Solanum bulbocastanum TaxID=147425 RepID=A0AAN8U114_SOLBU